MLQTVCEHIHNYFIKTILDGEYTIADGMISLPLIDGQRFLIQGSVLNDGMYTYHTSGIKDDDDSVEVGLHDETFTGTISGLAVPPAVIALSGEIEEWVEKYGEAVNSPYQSESVIGVYSYEKAQSGGRNSNNSSPVTWQDVYASSLNRWRKVAFC